MNVLKLFCVLLVCVACGKRAEPMVKYFDDGRAKPSVAILPVIDHVYDLSPENLPWDVSHELTMTVLERLSRSNEIYISASDSLLPAMSDYNGKDVFLVAPDEIAKLTDKDFLIMMELLEHKQVPYAQAPGKQHAYAERNDPAKGQILLTMRVKAIDTRGATPKVVFSQLVESRQLITKGSQGYNYSTMPPGSTQYPNTPVGKAHNHLASEVVDQLQAYLNMNL